MSVGLRYLQNRFALPGGWQAVADLVRMRQSAMPIVLLDGSVEVIGRNEACGCVLNLRFDIICTHSFLLASLMLVHIHLLSF
jgi:hypothetical protein